jgi:hypothetical protein
MGAQVVKNIQKWSGLNLREDPGVIQEHELQLCTNFNLGRSGELIKRTGFEKINTANLGPNSIKLLGHYYTATYSQILAKIGTSLYYSTDGVTWNLIGTVGQFNVEFGIQYVDKFIMVRKGGTILVWTGTGTPTAVTGSPGGDFCIIHKERLFVFDSTGTGQPNYRVYFSALTASGVPVTPDQATAWVSTNTFDVNAGDGDFLVGAAIVHDLLIIFKSRTSWGMYVQGASSADWVLRSLNKTIGCVSKYSIRVIEDLCYFVSAVNVFRTDGTSFKSISDPLLPVLKDRVVNLSNANIDSAFFWNDIYFVMVRPTTNTYRYFAFHLRINAWTEWVLSGNVSPNTFLEIRQAAPQSGVYCADINLVGNMYRYGLNVYTDSGVAYDSIIQTKDDDFELPSTMKRGW